MKILLVEDEKDLADAVTVILQKNNYSVDTAYDGETGLDSALSGIYDIIILDIMLPIYDGLHILYEIRKAGVYTPTLLLTARGELGDRVKGLDSGADDYLLKPFYMDELLARLRALLRRKGELMVDNLTKIGSLEFNPHTLKLSCNGKSVNLTLKESQLLELLISQRGSLVSKDRIIEKLWSYDADVGDSHVESQVSLLRKKLRLVGSNIGVRATRGVGYALDLDGGKRNV